MVASIIICTIYTLGPAADLCFRSGYNIRYGGWADLVDGMGVVVQSGCRKSAAVGPAGGGGDTSGYYTKPRKIIQSPKTLNNDITLLRYQYTKPQKVYTKIKYQVKPRNITQKLQKK